MEDDTKGLVVRTVIELFFRKEEDGLCVQILRRLVSTFFFNNVVIVLCY